MPNSLVNALLPLHTASWRLKVKWDGVNWLDETANVVSGGGINDLTPGVRTLNPDQCTIDLDNTAYRYSPKNTLSPLYAYLGTIGQPVQLELGYNGVYDVMFYGTLSNMAAGGFTATLTALGRGDRFRTAPCQLAPIGDQRTDQIMSALLVNAGFVAGVDFVLDVGTVIVQYACVPPGMMLLGELFQLTQTEGGRLFFDPANSGCLTFWNATHVASALASPITTLTTNAHAYDPLARSFGPVGICNDFEIDWVFRDYKDADGNLIDIPIYSNFLPGEDELQVLTQTGAPTGGYFTITFAGQTTTAQIPYSAFGTTNSWQAILFALAGNGSIKDGFATGLSNITHVDSTNHTPDISVTGDGPWAIEFSGRYARTNVAAVTINNFLTGGSSPTVTVTVIQDGGTGGTVVHNGLAIPAYPGGGNVSSGTTFAPGGGGQDTAAAAAIWGAHVPIEWGDIMLIIGDKNDSFTSGSPIQMIEDPSAYLESGSPVGYQIAGPNADGTLSVGFYSNRSFIVYIRVRIGGHPQPSQTTIKTYSSDAASILALGDIPLPSPVTNAYKPSDVIAQAIADRELARRKVPDDSVTLTLDWMPLFAQDYVVVTDTTIPGVTVTETKQILSHAWTIAAGQFDSVLKLGAP